MELNTAETLDEFEAAVSRMGEMNHNLVAADRNGIRYAVGVQVPKRSRIEVGREPRQLMNGGGPCVLLE